MTEDELLEGVTGALVVGGWLWTHARRSDLALMQGTPGVPDIIAVHPDRRACVALELKGEHGDPTRDQARWLQSLALAGVDARLVYPSEYDALVLELVGDRLQRKRKASA